MKDLGRVMGSRVDLGVISFERSERSGLRPKTRQWPGSMGMRMGGDEDDLRGLDSLEA